MKPTALDVPVPPHLLGSTVDMAPAKQLNWGTGLLTTRDGVKSRMVRKLDRRWTGFSGLAPARLQPAVSAAQFRRFLFPECGKGFDPKEAAIPWIYP